MSRLAAVLAAALVVAAAAAPLSAAKGGSGEIVFVARKQRAAPHFVFAVRGDGSGLRQLPAGKASIAHWSPDGRKVAVVGSAITVLNADGSGAVQLSVSCGGSCDVAWAPGGRQLAYTVASDCGKAVCTSRLGIVRADGRNRRVLLRFTGASVASPAWSPDGSQIAFVETASGLADLDVVDTNGRGFTRLAPVDGTAYFPEYRPSWTTTSARILFSARRGGAPQVLSVTRDGGELRTLAAGSYPVVSPDGKRVAFVRRGSAYVMPVSGGGKVKVATGVASALAWSPDSGKLAYVTSGHKVAVAAADGSEGRPVTRAFADVAAIGWRKA